MPFLSTQPRDHLTGNGQRKKKDLIYIRNMFSRSFPLSLLRLQLHHVAFPTSRNACALNGRGRKQSNQATKRELCVSIRMECMQFLWLHGRAQGLRDVELSSRCRIFVAIITVVMDGTSDGFQYNKRERENSNCLIDSLPCTHEPLCVPMFQARFDGNLVF